jgi:hypothetical protein
MRNPSASWRSPRREKSLLWLSINNLGQETHRGQTYTASATSLAICMRVHVAAKVPEMWFGDSFSFGGQIPKNLSNSGVTYGTGMAWEFTDEVVQYSRPT